MVAVSWFELILFVVAVVYAGVATISILRLSDVDEDEEDKGAGGSHSYQ